MAKVARRVPTWRCTRGCARPVLDRLVDRLWKAIGNGFAGCNVFLQMSQANDLMRALHVTCSCFGLGLQLLVASEMGLVLVTTPATTG